MLIKSTVRGYGSSVVNNLIVTSVMLLAAGWLNSFLTGALAEAGVSSVWEADVLDFDSPLPYFAYGLKWFLYVLTAVGAYEIAHNILYDARETNELTASGKNWCRIEKRSYAFPAARATDTAVINRVTEVVVSESTVDRILGTGTLKLKLTVFLNATEAQIEWTIRAVENPHRVAEQIRAKSLDHDGARVMTTLLPHGAREA